jgi:glycerol uptake operon antiterminator
MIFEGQQRLPALSNFSMIKEFLKTDIKYCILVDFQLAEIGSIISDLKSQGRKILVHIDMIKGLNADEFGAIHLIQNYHVDGIISIKPKVVAICKKRNVIAMQRIFLKDSISLKRSLEIISKTRPDCLEILPAVCTDIIQYIKNELQCEVFSGGLISSEEQIQSCLQAGAIGITVSNPKLWLKP